MSDEQKPIRVKSVSKKKKLIKLLIAFGAGLLVGAILATVAQIIIRNILSKDSDIKEPVQQIEEEKVKKPVSMEDTEVWDLPDSMTVGLLPEEGTFPVYMVCEISFKLDKNHDDFDKYGSDMDKYSSLIKDACRTVIASHNYDFCLNRQEELKEEILNAVQELFGSDFIYGIALSKAVFG